LLEFFDTSVFPIVDGGDIHAKSHSCLLITQPPTHDQSNRRLLVVRQVSQGCLEHPGVDPGDARAPDLRFRPSIGRCAESTPFFRGEPTRVLAAHRLERPSRSSLLVIPLADKVLTHSKEITHRDLARFEIFETEETKKHLLNHVLSTFGPDQAANERSKRPVMALVERTNHRPSRFRGCSRTSPVGRCISRLRAWSRSIR
jgi:hypothetical protein